jgi:hypothetical protein
MHPTWRLCLSSLLLSLPVTVAACSVSEDESSEDKGAFTSTSATLLDFEFDGEVVASNLLDARQAVRAQLFFTVGQLNGENSVGRVELAEITITEQNAPLVRYHAKLPVAWSNKTKRPSSYELIVPRDLGKSSDFERKYRTNCAEFGDDRAHDYWFAYRPKQSRCQFDDADVLRAEAKVTASPLNTQGRYPEYHRIWEDDRFEAITIFGKNEAGNMDSDPGTNSFNQYIRDLRSDFAGATLTTTPADLGDSPGPNTKDVTLEGRFPDGREFKVSVFLLDEMRSPWPGFTARYASLTPTADFIAYNGHAGLGGNIQALARMGSWVPNKYLVFFMNGCDTFAYIDGTLAKARGGGGADDPNGTKNLEFITNAMPSFFTDNVDSTLGLFRGLIAADAPKSYEEMLKTMPQSGVVVVNGEEDNVFRPGMPVRPQH